MQKVYQIFGWTGMFMILIAYFLVSFSLITTQNPIFQLLNLIGSIGIVFVAFTKKDYQPLVLNIVWILIAIVSLIKIIM